MNWLRSEILFLRGNRALSAADFTRAKELFRKALEFAPAGAGPYLRLAAAEQELGGEARVTELLEKAAALEPRNPVIPVLRGVVYTMQERFSEALPLLSAALERDPAQPLARACRGLALLRSGEREAGLALLREEIGNTNDRFQVEVLSFTESAVLQKAGAAKLVESILIPHDGAKEKEASRLARWVERLWPRRGKEPSQRERGERLLQERHYGDAITALAQALERSPEDDEASLLLAYAYLLDGKHKKALAQVKQLEEKGQASPAFARVRGLAELLSGRDEEAAETLNRVCQESTDFLDHHFCAVAHLPRNRDKKARTAFLLALRFAPEGWAAQRIAAFAELDL